MKVRICSTLIEPREVPIESSQGDHAYSVTAPTLFNDAVCECMGYVFRGRCRHVAEVVETHCRWVSTREEDFKLDRCPRCGNLAMTWETQPEYT